MFRLTAGLLTAALVTAAAPAADVEPTKLINEQLAAKWKAQEIKKVAARAPDHEFLRRAFIDLVGRIATPEEAIDFDQDKSADKRGRLVKRLLHETAYQPKVNGQRVPLPGGKAGEFLTFDYASEYAEHWSNTWAVWLLSRSGDGRYRDQMEVWLQTQFLKNTPYKDMVRDLLTATGKSNENGAVNFLALQLGEAIPDDPATREVDERKKYGPFDAVPVTSRVTRLFLGVQTQCSQCHDHPFNPEWVQADFWGVNAYFRQVTRSGRPTSPLDRQNAMNLTVLEVGDSDAQNPDSVILYEKRNGTVAAAKPAFLKDIAEVTKQLEDSKLVPSTKTLAATKSAKTRREALAHYVTSHDNFAKAYVNRVWGHLFGRGLNKEPGIDDFGSNNEVVHPELLDGLAAAFAKYNYDPKLLLEWVCTSDAYSLGHVAVKEYADPKYDPYFARMPLKALSPEVLFRSLMTATKTEAIRTRDEVKELERNWTAKLVRNFGDDEGNEMTFNGTIIQALMMMNGKELNDVVGTVNKNAVERVVLKHSRSGLTNVDGVLDDLFLMTLNRKPTVEERGKLKAVQQRGVVLKPEAPKPDPKGPPPKGKGKLPKGPPATPGVVLPSAPNDVTFYQDVFWALLNTNEFMLNH